MEPDRIEPDRIEPDPCHQHCPSRDLIDLVGDKWTLLVMRAVGEGVTRNGGLRRRVEGISQKMLTQTLRNLERNGLVGRDDRQTVPPHVEYSLTHLGASLRATLSGIDLWLESNMDAFVEARATFDRQYQLGRLDDLATGKQLNQADDERDDEQQVDEAASNVKPQTQRP